MSYDIIGECITEAIKRIYKYIRNSYTGYINGDNRRINNIISDYLSEYIGGHS